jgi:hypothetical protein
MTPRIKEQIKELRFYHRVMSKAVRQRDGSGCWKWKGNKVVDQYGFYPYGKVWLTQSDGRRKALQAHRVVYELHTGESLAGAVLVNQCGNTLCVNPAHWKVADHWSHA